jgi:hypothetical protein
MAGTARVAIGVFDNPALARQAVTELRQAGFADDRIGFIRRRDETADGAMTAGESAAAGAAAGAGLGALGALAAAAGGVLLPGVGPVLVGGGLLAAVLASTAGGAALGGVVGALVGLGIPEADARFYEEQLRTGQTLVTVHADDRYDEAVAILRRCGAYDVAMRRTAAGAASAEPPPDWVPSQAEEGVHTRREPLTQHGHPTTVPMGPAEHAGVGTATAPPPHDTEGGA